MRFDPAQVDIRLGSANKFKLIYPGPDAARYNKFSKKAVDIFQKATGTYIKPPKPLVEAKEEKPKKPKKKKKKALPKDTIEATKEPSKIRNGNEAADADIMSKDAAK